MNKDREIHNIIDQIQDVLYRTNYVVEIDKHPSRFKRIVSYIVFGKSFVKIIKPKN